MENWWKTFFDADYIRICGWATNLQKRLNRQKESGNSSHSMKDVAFLTHLAATADSRCRSPDAALSYAASINPNR